MSKRREAELINLVLVRSDRCAQESRTTIETNCSVYLSEEWDGMQSLSDGRGAGLDRVALTAGRADMELGKYCFRFANLSLFVHSLFRV